MVRSREVATVACVAAVLAACGTSGTDTRLADAGATTSSVGAATTTAPAVTETTASVATETTAVPETTTTTVSLDEQLAGDWFACEFVETPGEAPTDDCAIFDDDGLRFDSDGLLVLIERVGGTERNCLFDNRGTCFESSLEQIEITGELLAGWALDGTTIAVGGADCVGTVEWEPGENHSVFRPGEEDGCDVLRIDSNASDQADAGGVYFGRYEGTSEIVEG